MGKDETSFESPFAAAVNAIIDSHKKLYDILLTSFGIYNSGVVPPRTKRVSRILDCEANGAHTILESLAAAAKAEPRGSLGTAPDLLIAECRDFLDFLEDNLKSPDCAATINDIRQTEEAFTNLIKGLSGCDPNITTKEYHKRIDKFIRDLKDLFRNLGSATVKYEFTLSERAKKKSEESDVLKQILKKFEENNKYLQITSDATTKTAANTKNLRQDIRAIREGKTVTSELSGIDPLSRPKREEVNLVKKLIREHKKTNPNYSLLSVSTFVRKESLRIGRIGGYKTDLALNSRASTELKREENGLSPY